ncbi:hypothetical protein KP509_37G049900 [Ceratopteris richardii]|nr:hypothetical protein KP509_37G049900 [Ceratopteris richardii]
MRVAMDCPGCERKIRRALYDMEGVHTVTIDKDLQKVVVKGFVDRCEVLKRVKKARKGADYWVDDPALEEVAPGQLYPYSYPYNPYNHHYYYNRYAMPATQPVSYTYSPSQGHHVAPPHTCTCSACTNRYPHLHAPYYHHSYHHGGYENQETPCAIM